MKIEETITINFDAKVETDIDVDYFQRIFFTEQENITGQNADVWVQMEDMEIDHEIEFEADDEYNELSEAEQKAVIDDYVSNLDLEDIIESKFQVNNVERITINT